MFNFAELRNLKEQLHRRADYLAEEKPRLRTMSPKSKKFYLKVQREARALRKAIAAHPASLKTDSMFTEIDAPTHTNPNKQAFLKLTQKVKRKEQLIMLAYALEDGSLVPMLPVQTYSSVRMYIEEFNECYNEKRNAFIVPDTHREMHLVHTGYIMELGSIEKLHCDVWSTDSELDVIHVVTSVEVFPQSDTPFDY